MTGLPREILVGSDQFEVVTDDVLLRAQLSCAMAVCVFDTVDEAGALLHLRCVARQGSNPDATDTTLATELLLLDRCVEDLRTAVPQARALKAHIVVHLPAQSTARATSSARLAGSVRLTLQYAEINGRRFSSSTFFRPPLGSQASKYSPKVS